MELALVLILSERHGSAVTERPPPVRANMAAASRYPHQDPRYRLLKVVRTAMSNR
jgi:hypothetical protein